MEVFETSVLLLSGLALIYAGSIRLIYPAKALFLQSYLVNPTNKLKNDSDLLSEVRGIGAVMLIGAISILVGIVAPAFKITSFVVAAVIFLGVISGRLISLGIDGKPNMDIVKASAAEALLSLLNLFCLAYTLTNY